MPTPQALIGRYQNTNNQDLIQIINGSGLVSTVIPAAGVLPLPAPYTYLFSVSNGVISATNGATGQVDFSGFDAAVVVNAALNASTATGGLFLFKKGIYPILSLTQETAAGWTNYFYGIGTPFTALGSCVEFHFEGESGLFFIGEYGTNAIQNNGVIFNVTSTALAGISNSNIAVAVWQRPSATIGVFSNNIFLKNLTLRFPLNSRGKTIGSGMYGAGCIEYENVLVDFNQTYLAISTAAAPAAGSIGLTTTNSSSGNIQYFKNCSVVGCDIGYDAQSEHLVMDTCTSIYCNDAGIIGRGNVPLANFVYHPCVLLHQTDQECIRGWTLGQKMVVGSRVDFIGYDMEVLTSGTFNRVANFTETNPGNSSGILSVGVIQASLGAINPGQMFLSGGGQGAGFDIRVAGKVYSPGVISSSSTSAATTGTTKQTLATFTVSGGPQAGGGSIFINNAGAMLRIKAWGITAANANSKTVGIDFGGTTISSITSTVNNGVIEVEADIICGVNNVQECFGKAFDGTVIVLTRTSPGITATAAIVINLAATTPTLLGDFTFKGWTIEYLGGK